MKKLGKKKLIILIIIFVIILAAAGTAIYLIFLKKPEPVNAYFGKDEKVPSVIKVVGEREMEKVKTSKDKKKTTYTYIEVKKPADDIKKYVACLEEKHAFKDIEAPKEPDKTESDTAKTDTKKTEEKEAEKEAAKKHYELGANSVTAGKLLKITIDVKKDSYIVKTSTQTAKLNDILQKNEAKRTELEEKIKEEDNLKYTRLDAEATIKACTAEELGLPGPPSSFVVLSTEGRVQYDGIDYYDVRIYQDSPNFIKTLLGHYMVDSNNGETVLKYDIDTNVYTQVIPAVTPS